MKNYLPDAYRQLFPLNQESTGRALHAGENGAHHCVDRHYFEWWYFDIFFSDGSCLVVVFYASLFNVGDRRPTIDARYYPVRGERTLTIGRFAQHAMDVTADPFRVQLGDSWVVEEDGVYRLRLDEGSLAGELTFHPELMGWRMGSGRLFEDVSRDEYFRWMIPMPRAHVEGTLTINGDTRQVTGVGYHDHNWGNVYLPNIFRGWTWGRLWGGEWTLVLADMIGPSHAPRVTAMLIGHQGAIREVTNDLMFREEMLPPQNGVAPARRLSLVSTSDEDLQLSLTMNKLETVEMAALRSGLVRWRRLAEPTFYLSQRVPLLGAAIGALVGAGIYHRWSVHGTLHINGAVIELNGVVERLKLDAALVDPI